MSTRTPTRPTAWPSNAGAYRRAWFAGITALLIPVVSGYDVATVAALIVAGAADLGLLIAPDGTRGLRAHVKTVIAWLGWLLATALLAVAQVEGSGGDLQLGQLWLQLDSTDWLLIATLLGKAVLQTIVPNADPVYPEAADHDVEALDVPEPPRLPSTGAPLTPEGVTGLLPALTPAMIGELQAAQAAAAGGPAPLPALPSPRAETEPFAAAGTWTKPDVENVPAEVDLGAGGGGGAELAQDTDDYVDEVDDEPEHRAEPEPHALAGLLSRRRSR